VDRGQRGPPGGDKQDQRRYLIEAVRSVSDAKGEEEISDAVEQAVGHGATSGTDALTGFVCCMEGRL
jgi:hypothetical protein